ncbi:Eco57I restriction-modification methylase domain-containing protein [Dyadobacter sp. 3J3]|uniref:Eco57I restriction-modification methylase domain-containing protein n=1 Tax=Dyadobacter sp. 3J3 TaxID=2606600 RepID=UPI001358B7BD|nr:Eco57I restriction-modification methylase domain-containing protein [Dyadobacter sp. 3J3]
MVKHKTLGQVFTPTWIVKEILNLIGYNDDSILDKYILEPSSGDGVFLIEIVERYINVCLNNKLETNQIIDRLEKYIYGVELDKLEFDKSIENLDRFVEKKLSISKKINWKIYNQNTLDFFKEHLNFFDFIAGNPPYIRIHNLDTKTRDILKRDFLFSEGTVDIYLSFFEMGFKMLKRTGLLGYITPNSYLHNSSYKLFREYLKNKKIVKTLIDFKANKVFKSFSTYTAITIIDKNYDENYFEYKELINDKIECVNRVYFENLKNGDWSFSNTKDQDFLSDLVKGRNCSIKDFFDVQYGFATLRDKIFISRTKYYNEDAVYFNDYLVEKNILKTVVKGSRFKGEINNNDQILFPYELENNRYRAIPEGKLKENYPNAYNYLLKNKEELEKRDLDKGALWYEFGRSQGIQSIHKEKIVLSTLVNGRIDFYKVPKDIMIYSGLFIIKNKEFSDWALIENTLKSDEFYKYIRLTGKDFSGGYKSITSKQIKEFKIKAHNPETLF